MDFSTSFAAEIKKRDRNCCDALMDLAEECGAVEIEDPLEAVAFLAGAIDELLICQELASDAGFMSPSEALRELRNRSDN